MTARAGRKLRLTTGLCGLALFLLVPAAVWAETVTPSQPAIKTDTNVGIEAFQENEGKTNSTVSKLQPALSVPIPPVILRKPRTLTIGETDYIDIPWIADYIAGAFRYGVSIGGVLAVVMMMIGGFRYVTAGGDTSRVMKAKECIGDAVLGLSILLGSFLILNTINPDLVFLPAIRVVYIKADPFENPDPIPPFPEGTAVPATTDGSDGVPLFSQCGPDWRYWIPDGPEGVKTDTWRLQTEEEKKVEAEYFAAINAKPKRSAPDRVKGSCTNICQRGCGPTSVAMIMKFHGFAVTPVDMGKVILNCGGGSGGMFDRLTKGLAIGDLKKQSLTKKYGVKAEALPPATKMERIKTLLENKQPLLFGCNDCTGYRANGKSQHYGGHFMVLTGYDAATGMFRVNDPNGNPNQRMMTIHESDVAAHGGLIYICKEGSCK